MMYCLVLFNESPLNLEQLNSLPKMLLLVIFRQSRLFQIGSIVQLTGKILKGILHSLELELQKTKRVLFISRKYLFATSVFLSSREEVTKNTRHHKEHKENIMIVVLGIIQTLPAHIQ